QLAPSSPPSVASDRRRPSADPVPECSDETLDVIRGKCIADTTVLTQFFEKRRSPGIGGRITHVEQAVQQITTELLHEWGRLERLIPRPRRRGVGQQCLGELLPIR